MLLHGLSANHTEWLAIAAHLGRTHRVILPDLLGRGSSSPEPHARFTLSEETERIGAILDSLGVSGPLLAGHSNGASLALSLASRIPCRRVVLFSPVTPWTERPASLRFLRSRAIRSAIRPLVALCRRPLTRYILTRRVYGDRPPPIEDAVGRYADPYADPARALALLQILVDWDPSVLWGLPVPQDVSLHVVTGDRDRRIPHDEARRWARWLGADFTLIAGAGHGLTEERAEMCAQILAGKPVAPRSDDPDLEN